MKKFRLWLPFAGALAAGLMVSNLSPVQAQTAATVTVNASSSLGTIPAAAFGVNTAVFDNYMLDSTATTLLKNAGTTALRYPGGSDADAFHWQTTTFTPGVNGWINTNNTFDSFMAQVAQPMGAMPVITVNYGSNAAGTGGGDPNEAAAWVDYANNTQKYGIKYWEIGNEIPGNGEYGAQWETDLHDPDTSQSLRTGAASLGPTAYGQNVVQFVSAMKAKDPTIKIGVVMCTPGSWPDGVSPDWNSNMLAACGTKIDFVIIHFYPETNFNETDAGLLGTTSQIAGLVSKTKSLINQYCGSNASNVQICITETNPGVGGKQSVSLISGLFGADDYMTWLENGISNIDWWDEHNGPVTNENNSSSLYGTTNYGDGGILSIGGIEPAMDTPFPAYYGLQMAATKLGKPGDTMVPASTNQSLLTAHAVLQANGNLALMLINKDPNNSYAANLSLSGYTPTSTATDYFYGENSTAITSSSVSTGSSITVPPYSLTTVVMTPGASAPTFTAAASASPSTIAPGANGTITASFKDTGGAASNLVTDIEVYNSSGTKVAQQTYSGQNFTAGGTNTYNWSWTAPTTTGTYTVSLGVFNSTWSTGYYWGSNAATITVATVDNTQYNFENGVQGWTSGGAPITSIAASSSQTYLGSQGLAVNFNASAAGGSGISVSSPSVPAGATITFHIWVPTGNQISSVQPYILDGNWSWTGNWQYGPGLTPNAWNTITLAVPTNAALPLNQMGVQFSTGAAWTGTCYVDSIGWPTPPITSASLSGTAGNSGWYRSAVAVTLTAAAGTNAVAATYYTVDGGANQTYTTPFTVSSDGTHPVSYWSVDTAGTAETAGAQSIKIDATAPVTTVSGVTAGSTVAGPVTITLAANDNLSGVASTSYAIDGGASQTYSAPFSVSAGGSHTVTYFSTDLAGNIEATNSVTFTIAVAGVTDVSGQITVTLGGYRYNPGTHLYGQSVTLTNNGASIVGPISLVLANLTSNVVLSNANGTTSVFAPSGRPYVNAAGLASGTSETIALEFTDSTKVAISYATQVLAGSGSR